MAMKTSPDVLVAHLAGEAVLLNLADKSYYRLNETAATIWASLEKGESRDSILEHLLSRYEVNEDVAREELDRTLSEFAAKGFVTI